MPAVKRAEFKGKKRQRVGAEKRWSDSNGTFVPPSTRTTIRSYETALLYQHLLHHNADPDRGLYFHWNFSISDGLPGGVVKTAAQLKSCLKHVKTVDKLAAQFVKLGVEADCSKIAFCVDSTDAADFFSLLAKALLFNNLIPPMDESSMYPIAPQPLLTTAPVVGMSVSTPADYAVVKLWTVPEPGPHALYTLLDRVTACVPQYEEAVNMARWVHPSGHHMSVYEE